MPSSRRSSSRPRKRVPSPARLPGALAHRFSSYLDQMGELVAEGTLDPRAWIDVHAQLASTAVSDVGDWLELSGGGPLRESRDWIPRFSVEMAQGQATTKIRVTGSRYMFLDRARERELRRVKLVTSGMTNQLGLRHLPADQHLRVVPEQVELLDGVLDPPAVEVKLFNLHQVERGIYFGLVTTLQNARPVAILELEIR